MQARTATRILKQEVNNIMYYKGRIMKYIISLLTFFVFSNVWATCTSPISRTAFSPNTVLTSSDLNTQFNTVYNHSNDLDGSCLTDNTVTSDKLDTSDLSVLLTTIKEGCKVIYNNASSVDVDKCKLSINGNLVETTGLTNVAMGCGSCDAEAASTVYYVYALSTSDGSTLNLKLSTTAPDNIGLSSNDRVLGRLYNNTNQDIDTYSIDQWVSNGFVPQDTGVISAGGITNASVDGTTSDPTIATNLEKNNFYVTRLGKYAYIKYIYRTDSTATGAANGSGDYIVDYPLDLEVDTNYVDFYTGGAGATVATDESWRSYGSFVGVIDGVDAALSGGIFLYDANSFRIWYQSGSAYRHVGSTAFEMTRVNAGYTIEFKIPIAGWSD